MSRISSKWPSPGLVDMAKHDLPHAWADTEWWYVNSHFQTADGRELSLFAAFFRIVARYDETTGEPVEHAHSVTWALTDVSNQTYYPDSRVDAEAPRMGLERIKNGRGSKDPRLNRAISEILERGDLPAPDRVFRGEIHVAQDRLALNYDGARFEKQDDGNYRLRLNNDRDKVSCDLVFSPEKPPIRHGDDGIVRGTAGEDMFYYFVPRCGLRGSVSIGDEQLELVSGQGWYDHEFGGHTSEKIEPTEYTHDLAWNWVAIQLEDGTDISAYEIIDCANDTTVGKWMIVVAADGKQRSVDDFSFEPGRRWNSTRTFHDYPVCWKLKAPSIGLDVSVDAVFDDQEFITLISKPAFWEGRCQAKGVYAGKPATGPAFVERSGFEHVDTLDEFFGAVGKEVRKSVQAVMPLDPSYEQLRGLVASEESDHYMQGVDSKTVVDKLIAPIREITDRGGKSWRSYAALACCDVVGGDSREYVQWLAMPELMHVGSLIVDDVQDGSTIRRGGPSCHLVYGEPLAINAGTAAYFMTQKLLIKEGTPAETKVRLYDLYFQAMRAGHAGQALDLGGVDDALPGVIETGNTEELEERILACHRLKTAVPAGSLAAMGAVVGGGSDEQVVAVNSFFEALGLAFQIIDDVLNLRGFKGNLKQLGEDIAHGTITLPVAKGLAKLPADRRTWLVETVASKPTDQHVIDEVISVLEACGALEACVDQARELVEDAWKQVESLIEPSISSVMLRAFGWYILERHY